MGNADIRETLKLIERENQISCAPRYYVDDVN